MAIALLASHCTETPTDTNPCPEKDKLIEEQSFRITNLSQTIDVLNNNISGQDIQIHILRDRLDNIVPDTVTLMDTTVIVINDTIKIPILIHDTLTIYPQQPHYVDSVKMSAVDPETVSNFVAYIEKDSMMTIYYYLDKNLDMIIKLVHGQDLFNHYKERVK